MTTDFYMKQKPKLMKGFAQASGWFNPHLTRRYGRPQADAIQHMAQNEYAALIPHIPYIGGSRVHMTSDLLESVLQLAYLKALQAHEKTIDESGEILLEALQTRLAQYPRFLLRLLGRLTFSRLYLANLQREARESQKREYPGGFVFNVVIGDGKEFDWGLDFAECGICKFYQSQGAAAFMPVVCPVDYALSDAFGYGLVRTETLAEGAARCNPRMKRGRQTEWRLPRQAGQPIGSGAIA